MCAYTNADTRAKVGFRPYYATDPFGAAHLSGYGSGLGRPENPFQEENWVLHPAAAGLGDYFYNRPFDPWELYSDTRAGLHGLGYLGDAAAQDIAQGMISEGYDQRIIDNLVAQGATAADLQYLWDNYSPVPPNQGGNPADYFGTAAVKMMSQLATPPTGTQFQNALKSSGAIPVGPPGNLTPPSQTYAAQGPQAVTLQISQQPPESLLTWAESNTLWILLGVGAITVLPALLGRRR